MITKIKHETKRIPINLKWYVLTPKIPFEISIIVFVRLFLSFFFIETTVIVFIFFFLSYAPLFCAVIFFLFMKAICNYLLETRSRTLNCHVKTRQYCEMECIES